MLLFSNGIFQKLTILFFSSVLEKQYLIQSSTLLNVFHSQKIVTLKKRKLAAINKDIHE